VIGAPAIVSEFFTSEAPHISRRVKPDYFEGKSFRLQIRLDFLFRCPSVENFVFEIHRKITAAVPEIRTMFQAIEFFGHGLISFQKGFIFYSKNSLFLRHLKIPYFPKKIKPLYGPG